MAQTDLKYVVAYSFVHGAPGLAAFSESAIGDPQVKDLAGRTAVAIDPVTSTTLFAGTPRDGVFKSIKRRHHLEQNWSG